MPINPIPQPVDVIINPSGEPPKIKDFIINAPLIVQSTNVKNKLDSLDSTSENLSQRVAVLETRPIATASGPSGDYVPTSRTINSHALTADITITKSDLGLASVDNTSDINKPVSTAQAAADAAVLISANAYTDAHGGGGGSTTPDTITPLVTPGGATSGQNTLRLTITDSLSAPRIGVLVMLAWTSTRGAGDPAALPASPSLGTEVAIIPGGVANVHGRPSGLAYAITDASGRVQWLFNAPSGTVTTCTAHVFSVAPKTQAITPFTAP